MPQRSSKADGEELDYVLQEIEEAYGFSISRDAFDTASTLNDVADRLWEQMPASTRQGGKCGSSVAFYCVKSWLDQAYPDVDWRPNTRFAAVPGFRYDRLEREFTGWDVPGRHISHVSRVLAVLSAVAFAGATWPVCQWWLVLLMPLVYTAVVMPLHIWVFRRSRPYAATPGCVASHMTGHNIGRLRDAGVTLSRKALRRIFETCCDAKPNARIV